VFHVLEGFGELEPLSQPATIPGNYIMEVKIRAWFGYRSLLGAVVAALALAYLLGSTQFLFPAHEWLTAARSAPAEAGFACALHKCGCKNAQECQLKCCCFPKKKTIGDGHDHEHDGMAHLNECSPFPDNGKGLSMHFAPHILLSAELIRLPLLSQRLPPVAAHHPLQPPLDTPLKVPI
jgi:hypothetical protein